MASILVTLVIHCRFDIYVGEYPEFEILNGLSKLSNCFYAPDYADLLVLGAIYLLLHNIIQKDAKIDFLSLAVSFVMAVTLMACISFRKFNSADMLFQNTFQILMFFVCVAGFWVIIYGIFRLVYHLFQKGIAMEKNSVKKSFCEKSFLQKHFSLIGFSIILAGWLPWILLNYPGTGCPDAILQLKQFLGDAHWGAGHPPLSSCIIGSLFVLGRRIVDVNFGFFLYCFLQTLAGACIFSYSMKKLLNLGLSVKWCMLGIAFFAFTPLWGTYAQWVEKDLFYTEIAVLQTCCMMEIFCKKSCDRKNGILLTCSSLGGISTQ